MSKTPFEINVPDQIPVGDVRNMIDRKINEGIICPCCGQLCKKSPTGIDKGTAKALIFMYKMHTFQNEDWVHSSKLHPISGNYTKPKYWGLIEEMTPELDPRVVEGVTKTSGNWRLTTKGHMFVEGKTLIQEKAILFNKVCYGYTGKMVSITDCLKKPFRYQDLWNGTTESLI